MPIPRPQGSASRTRDLTGSCSLSFGNLPRLATGNRSRASVSANDVPVPSAGSAAVAPPARRASVDPNTKRGSFRARSRSASKALPSGTSKTAAPPPRPKRSSQQDAKPSSETRRSLVPTAKPDIDYDAVARRGSLTGFGDDDEEGWPDGSSGATPVDEEFGGGFDGASDEDAAGEGEGEEGAGVSEEEIQACENQLQAAEPKRSAPPVFFQTGPTQYVHQSASPFPHRMHTIAFPPTDRPFVGDPNHGNTSAWVTPNTLDPLPCQTGRRRRIGRKKKFGDLRFFMPEGTVRFSATLGALTMAGFTDTREATDRWSVRWSTRVEPDDYKNMLGFQKVNHFPGTWGIGRKDNLHRRLMLLKQRDPENFKFAPDGFLLPGDARALSLDMAAKQHCPKGLKNNVYIVKQVASACGRGMRLLSKGNIPKGKFLVQRYIHNPMLAHGYKFDLRLYVVVTSFNPLRAYVYEEGLVRMASTPYPRDSSGSTKGMRVKKITAHLTNYSINKHNKDEFVAPEDTGDGQDDEKASKWVLSTVKRYFQSRGLDWEGTWAKVEDTIIKTLLSVEPDVANKLRNTFPTNPAANNCFELFGFDVLLTEDLDPVLMEVNIMCSLSTTCSLLDQRVKANMIADMLTLVGPYAPGKAHRKRPEKFGHPFLDDNGLSNVEKDVIVQTEEENQRRMHFKRLFPTHDAWDRYRPIFPEIVRPLNTLLSDWEKAKLVIPPHWTLPPTTGSPAEEEQEEEDGRVGEDDGGVEEGEEEEE